VVTRLTTAWQQEYRQFAERDLSGVDYVYVCVDGIHFKVRLDQDWVCTLVIVGARADGKKELVALSDGHRRESTESWADLLRDGKRRGMRAPVLAVGDGALGFWAALREVFSQTREQRDWVHKAANVLDALPKSAHPAARKALAEIRDAGDRQHAEKVITAFANLFGTKHTKAVAKIVDGTQQLLAFYDFPAEHWVHLKTSNPIESTFATVRLRTKVTKGPGSHVARTGDGVQARGGGQRTLALSQWCTPGRAGPRRRQVREEALIGRARRGRHQGRRVINQHTAIVNF
jgi:transposase-like protein